MNLSKEGKKRKGQNEKEREGGEGAVCGRIFSKEKRKGKMRRGGGFKNRLQKNI